MHTGDAFTVSGGVNLSLGFSLEAASIEPETNILYAYLSTTDTTGKRQVELFGLKVVQTPVWRRATQFEPIRHFSTSQLMISLERIQSPEGRLPSKFFFTLFGRLYMQLPRGTSDTDNAVVLAGACQACPTGLTSIGAEAVSMEECTCPTGQFIDPVTGLCRELTNCAVGEYTSIEAGRSSDRQCTPCPVCSPGSFVVRFCGIENGVFRDTVCRPCGNCNPGYRRHIDACNGAGRNDIDARDAAHCVPCKTCNSSNFEFILAESKCDGSTTYDTHVCGLCDTSACTRGTYIPSNVCNGLFYADSYKVDLKDCKPCYNCEQGKITIGGCSGRDRDPNPVCMQCETACSIGQYVKTTCTPTDPSVTCEYCTRQCQVGTYFAGACSGTANYQDINCPLCETCAPGQYISQQCPGGNRILNDTHRCSECSSACSVGFYVSSRCTGASTSDTTACKRCNLACAAGQYIRSPCDGTTSVPDSNDCQPCLSCGAGAYISGGRCANGTATNNTSRTCSPCRICKAGEYITEDSRCHGQGVANTQQCASCASCPQGHFISKACDGRSYASNPHDARTCSPCRSCPAGHYRVGCSGNSTHDDVQCLPCRNCSKGQWISAVCDGRGFSHADTVCTNCGSCGQGEYYASGCTGVETVSLKTCRRCSELCPAWSYVAEGCKGDANSFRDKPSRCNPCRRACSLGLYATGTECNGQTFQDVTPRCTECVCPLGSSIVERCSGSGLQDHLCTNGWAGPDRPRALGNTTQPAARLQQTTSPSVNMPSTTRMLMPSTTPSSNGGRAGGTPVDASVIGGALGGVAALAVVCLAAWYGPGLFASTGGAAGTT